MQRKNAGTIAIVLLCTLLVVSKGAEGQIYSWTDADGVRHFSNLRPDEPSATVEVMTETPHDEAADTRRREADQAALERRRESNRKDEATAPADAGREPDRPPAAEAPAVEPPARSEVPRDTIYIIERPWHRPAPHRTGNESETLLPPSAPPRSRFGHRPTPPPGGVRPPEVRPPDIRPPEIRPPEIRPPPALPPPQLNPSWRLLP